jgi:peptide-methionine (S)-S-oxide reductase
MLEDKDFFSKELVTEIKPLEKFYYAEEYHQDYEKNNPNNPYVRNVSIPRLKKFQKLYPELLKDVH